MDGRITGLFRYPVKGFTPERLDTVSVNAGGHFPHDRRFAVERGPCGFDPAAPAHVPKWRFTVLANHPELARVVATLDTTTGWIELRLQDDVVRFDLGDDAGRIAFTLWLGARLELDDTTGPLRVVESGPDHRFTDDIQGMVSVANLASIQELAGRMNRRIDPLRLRSNVHVAGWEAWSELELKAGARLRLGEVEMEVVKPIRRCIATHVDPDSGERDLEFVQGLQAHYGHVHCGIYVRPLTSGRIAHADPARSFPTQGLMTS